MLAYVFWHWRKDGVAADLYERLLGEFHASLGARRPEGLRGSAVFAMEGAPWVPAGRSCYEDWYFLDGSAALDPLNEAAVSSANLKAHDEVARLAAGGAAGVYKLRLGSHRRAGARRAAWFAKPPGMTYRGLEEALRPLAAGSRGALWGRHMGLGPAPEFCLAGPEPSALPAAWGGLPIERREVWV